MGRQTGGRRGGTMAGVQTRPGRETPPSLVPPPRRLLARLMRGEE